MSFLSRRALKRLMNAWTIFDGRWRCSAGSVAVLILAASPPIVAQEPSLDIVLARAAAYVADFNRQFSAIVAEEEYVQDMTMTVAGQPRHSHRVLKSDLLLVRASDIDRYIDFRDVFEVDGMPVRNREERLAKLLREGGTSSARFRQIVSESSRYNLGLDERIQRTLNTPTLALHFLEASQRSRFKFKRTKERTVALNSADSRTVAGRPLFYASTELWVIEYREVEPGTVIRTPEGRDAPSRGRFWIEPSTGRVLMTELLVGSSRLRSTIDVTYQSDATIGLLAPVQMRERYEARNLVLTGTATYGNFR